MASTFKRSRSGVIAIYRWVCADGTVYYRGVEDQTIVCVGSGAERVEPVQITAHHRVTDCEHLTAARCLLDAVTRLGGVA